MSIVPADSFKEIHSAPPPPPPTNTLNINVSTTSSRGERRKKRAVSQLCSQNPQCMFCKEAVIACTPPRPAYACSKSCQQIVMHEDCAQKELQAREQPCIAYDCSVCKKQVKIELLQRDLFNPKYPLQWLQSVRYQGVRPIATTLLGIVLRISYFVLCCWLYGLAGKALAVWCHGVRTQWENFDLAGATTLMYYNGKEVREGWWDIGYVHCSCAASFWILLYITGWLAGKLQLRDRVKRLLFAPSMSGACLFEKTKSKRHRKLK